MGYEEMGLTMSDKQKQNCDCNEGDGFNDDCGVCRGTGIVKQTQITDEIKAHPTYQDGDVYFNWDSIRKIVKQNKNLQRALNKIIETGLCNLPDVRCDDDMFNIAEQAIKNM